MANGINELTGNEIGVVFRPKRDWDRVVRKRVSIEKARKVLGYELKTDMKTGLGKTYEWFQGKLEEHKGTRKILMGDDGLNVL